MSFIYNNNSSGSGGGSVSTVTGNSGGAVSPTAGNINIVGSGGVIVTGNPGTSTLTITDSGSLRSTTYVAVTPYTVLLTDDIILVDTATIAAPSTIRLPNAPGASSDGQVWTIKDWSGSAGLYPITLTTVGGAVGIDGATSFVLLNNHESVSVAWSQSQGDYAIVSEVNTITQGIITIDGDAGSVNGTVVSIVSGNAANTSGETIMFSGSGSTLTLQTTDSNSNTTIGQLAGKAGMSGSANTGFGSLALTDITTGLENTAVGYGALSSIASDNSNVAMGMVAASSIAGGSFNTALGASALTGAVAASYNTTLGYNAGSLYTSTESSNIMINNSGTAGESNTLRIGKATGTGSQDIKAAYISGIAGVSVGSTANVVTNTGSTDQLGTATITAGAGISITPTANVITIASAGIGTLTITPVNHAASPYTVLTTDQFLAVDSTAGAVTINLPNAPTTGRSIIIKDKTGTATGANAMTITTVGGTVTIDTLTSQTSNTAFQSTTVVFDGTGYEIY